MLRKSGFRQNIVFLQKMCIWFLSQLDCRKFMPEHFNIIIRKQLCGGRVIPYKFYIYFVAIFSSDCSFCLYHDLWYKYQNQPPEVFCKKTANFAGKHLCWSLFLIKLRARGPATLLKKRLQLKCFPIKFATFLRKPILNNICEQLLLK